MIKNSPLFILGVPRSGTTLLAELLSNTKYGEAFETHFIPKFYHALENYQPISEKQNVIKLLKDITKERVIAHWEMKIDYDAFYRDLNHPISYQQIINQLCLYSEDKQKHEFWGDKTPKYLEDIELIIKLFPTSKFIIIIRDGRDVALSLLQKPWGPNNIYTCAQHWKKINNKIKNLENETKHEQRFYLQYEALIEQCPKQLKKLHNFLDEPYQQEMIDKSCKTIKTGNSKKWKTQLTENQIKTFEQVASKTLQQYNYETSHEETTISYTKQLFYKLHDKILLVKHLLILNLIDTIKIRFVGKKPFDE